MDAIQKNLTDDGFVLRYRPEASNDGLPGTEGVFLACSFWLADALLGIGRHHEAVELWNACSRSGTTLVCSAKNGTPAVHRQLGNTPQAFSHFPSSILPSAATTAAPTTATCPTQPSTLKGAINPRRRLHSAGSSMK